MADPILVGSGTVDKGPTAFTTTQVTPAFVRVAGATMPVLVAVVVVPPAEETKPEPSPVAPDRAIGQDTLRGDFEERAALWRRESRRLSSITKATGLRSYTRVIALGPAVVPILIKELERDPTVNWHTALCILASTNPVDPADAGNVRAIAGAWRAWWEEHKHLY